MRTATTQGNFKVSAKTALVRRGLNVKQLAAALGYTREAVSGAINRGRNRGVRRAVARHLDIPDHD